MKEGPPGQAAPKGLVFHEAPRVAGRASEESTSAVGGGTPDPEGSLVLCLSLFPSEAIKRLGCKISYSLATGKEDKGCQLAATFPASHPRQLAFPWLPAPASLQVKLDFRCLFPAPPYQWFTPSLLHLKERQCKACRPARKKGGRGHSCHLSLKLFPQHSP